MTENLPQHLVRPSSAGLDAILGESFPVLDHGFVRVIDYMGDDAAVVQAARVSYGRGTKSASDDAALIHYLMRHRHTTPFEMCEIKLHVKLPIFVARQWIRHRTASVNEVSARYSILDNEFYVPDAEHLGVQSTANKQGQGNVVTSDVAEQIQVLLRSSAQDAYEYYQALLGEDVTFSRWNVEATRLQEMKRGGRFDGIARELARMGLSLNFYTQWYWKVDVHNLLHFLSLRADPHAQYEIRVYAQLIYDEVVKPWLPATATAFDNCVLRGARLTGNQVDALRAVLRNVMTDEEIGQKIATFMGAGRERDELIAAFVGRDDVR